MIDRKLVIVGDDACGKTSLLLAFSNGKFPEGYVPTVLEGSVADVEVGKNHIKFELWDSSTQQDYDRFRPLIYPGSHVILICFAIDSPDSLENVKEKWISEITHFCIGLPIILVGCRKDVRSDPRRIEELRKTGLRPVASEEGMAVARRIGVSHYFECSAKSGEGVLKVLQHAAKVALAGSRKSTNPSPCCTIA